MTVASSPGSPLPPSLSPSSFREMISECFTRSLNRQESTRRPLIVPLSRFRSFLRARGVFPIQVFLFTLLAAPTQIERDRSSGRREREPYFRSEREHSRSIFTETIILSWRRLLFALPFRRRYFSCQREP